MEKVWLKSYPEDVPAEIGPLTESSLGELLVNACRRHGEKLAYLSMGVGLRYADLDRRSTEFAGWLQSIGAGKGARVALMMPNLLQYPVCMFGALRAGCVVVNCNPLYTPRELEHQIKDSGAEVMVVVENFAHTVEQILPRTSIRHVIVTSMGEMLGLKGLLVNLVVRHIRKMVPAWRIASAIGLDQALAAGGRHGFQAPAVGLDDLAFLQYTGGTTGVAKGDALSVKVSGGGAPLLADLVICAAGVRPNIGFLAGSGIEMGRGIRVDDRMRTSIAGIYAAGDVTEAAGFHSGQPELNAIQPNAADQAQIAAKNMAAHDLAGAAPVSQGSLAINVLDTLGLISTSFGQWQGLEKAQGGDGVELVDEANFRYLSLQFKDDVLIGATSIGWTDHVGALRGLIQTRARLGVWKDRLIADPTSFMAAYLATAQKAA